MLLLGANVRHVACRIIAAIRAAIDAPMSCLWADIVVIVAVNLAPNVKSG